MIFCRYIFFCLIALIASFSLQGAIVTDYLPKQHKYNPDITLPKEVLGFSIGERYPRHDQLLDYMGRIAGLSDRILMTEIGKTAELRKQILLTISSPNNLANLDNILEQQQNKTQTVKDTVNQPLIIWLGYSIHGDEISGANAAMVLAYHLAASQESSVASMLENTIIVLEPSMNPDGMDQFVNWVTTHRGSTPNSDENHIEHHQNWRTGRTNHFGFDLNRDWSLLSQIESQNRLKYFHRYLPHVFGDFHEMAADESYFFQPGIRSQIHPLTPKVNIELTQLLASYHAKALDNEQRLYFSGEKFDDFYYGKGSTYPDINGGVGILFEQASSKGMLQSTPNGLLSFEDTIKNHVLTSLSTLEGTWENKDKFIRYQNNFFDHAKKTAKQEKFSGYLISETDDIYRLNAFLSVLQQHHIEVFALKDDFRLNGQLFHKDSSYYIPLEQPQYRMIEALFTQQKNFQSNIFYDVSGWTMPLAMNINVEKVGRTWGLKTSENTWQKVTLINSLIDKNAYAYAFDWHDYLAPKLLNKLLSANIRVRVATQPFIAIVAGVKKEFLQGAIVIPAGIQTITNWHEIIDTASKNNEIEVASLSTGLTFSGVDIGSSSMVALKQPKILLVGGRGVSESEVGEVLYYVDKTLNIPVSVVEKERLHAINLNVYSHIIMVDGQYQDISSSLISNIEIWVKKGGVIFGQKRAAHWLADQGLLNIDFVRKEHIEQLFDTEYLTYQDKAMLAGRKRISGAIFESVLDITHPLAYGYANASLPLFKNNTLIMQQPEKPFVSVAKYTPTPLMSGYTDRNLINKIANNAAIVAHNVGEGRVIASSDNLVFRGYWYGSAKLLANSLFFAKAFSAHTEH